MRSTDRRTTLGVPPRRGSLSRDAPIPIAKSSGEGSFDSKYGCIALTYIGPDIITSAVTRPSSVSKKLMCRLSRNFPVGVIGLSRISSATPMIGMRDADGDVDEGLGQPVPTSRQIVREGREHYDVDSHGYHRRDERELDRAEDQLAIASGVPEGSEAIVEKDCYGDEEEDQCRY